MRQCLLGRRIPNMHPLFRASSVIPVLTIDRESDAVPLARALGEGGLSVIEVAMRTPAATAVIAAIAGELPHIVVGAGTLLRAADIAASVQAGARFLVSPGTTPELAAAALATELPYLPGVATPSEVMLVRSLGICVMKLFPAAALGGIAEQSFADYLALPNVPMVGGSWMAPPKAIAAGDWPRIRRLAERAARLGR